MNAVCTEAYTMTTASSAASAADGMLAPAPEPTEMATITAAAIHERPVRSMANLHRSLDQSSPPSIPPDAQVQPRRARATAKPTTKTAEPLTDAGAVRLLGLRPHSGHFSPEHGPDVPLGGHLIALLSVLRGTASGQITLRRIDGWRKIATCSVSVR